MLALWFYRPHNIVGQAVAFFTRGEWAHVGVVHAVTDVAVMTEAHPTRGVYCRPVSKVRKPDASFHLDIPDDWATKWLVERWGMRYGWFDAAALSVPSSHTPFYNHDGVICTELVVRLLQDAACAGHTVPGGLRWLNELSPACSP